MPESIFGGAGSESQESPPSSERAAANAYFSADPMVTLISERPIAANRRDNAEDPEVKQGPWELPGLYRQNLLQYHERNSRGRVSL